MLAIALAILPVFALILAGYLARRTGVLGPQAATELNRFVVYMALPALLFSVTAGTPLAELWQPELIGTFFISALIVGGIIIVTQRLRRRELADAVIDGLNGCYSNSVYLGLPVCLVLLGPGILAPVSLLGAVSVAGLFILAVLIIEIGRHAGHHPFGMIGKVGGSLLRNPLFISPLAGTLWSASGLALPGGVQDFLKLLSTAASPCALVALGLFLALPHSDEHRQPAFTIPWLSLMKLIVQPAIAAVIAFRLIDMPRETAILAVLITAMPTGTGPSMVAELYRRDMRVTSGTVALSTIAGIVSLSLCALLLGIAPV